MTAHDILVDQTATAVIEAVLAGDLPEQDGRMQLADLAGRSKLIESALPYRAIGGEARNDVLGSVYETVTTKILVPSSRGFNFELARGSSFSGFVRNLTRAVAPTAVRNEVYRPTRHTSPLGFTDALPEAGNGGFADTRDRMTFEHNSGNRSATRLAFATQPDLGADTHFVDDDEREFSDEVDTIVRGATHMFRVAEHHPHYAAALVLKVTGTPHGVRPLSPTKRKRALKLLDGKDGIKLAVASLRAYADEDDDAVASELTDLWGDYTPEDASILLCRDDMMIHAVAVAAVSRFPLPNYRSRASLPRTLAALGPDNDAYVALLPALVQSLLAVECHHGHSTQAGEPVSDADEASWSGLVCEVANLPGAPLGRTITTVRTALRNALMATMTGLTYEGVLDAAIDKLARRARKNESE